MSNLGGYQWLTTTAKKVGGPRNLVVLLIVSGVVGGKISGNIVKTGVRAIKKHYATKKIKVESKDKQYTIKIFGVSNEGVAFSVGEQFRVLESDGDAVLIEKLGDEENPYFVSAELLKEISDYEMVPNEI